jgi:hypothetical protein
MRRLLMVWAVATLMAALMALMAAPAMARDFFDDNDFNDGVLFFGNNLNDHFFGNNGLRSGIDQESESRDVNIGFRVSNSGDFASQCTPAIQEGNTGNFSNGSSFVQFGSGTNDGLRDRGFFFGNDGFFNRGGIDDFEPGGIDVSFGGSQNVSCPSTIQQSSAASS